MKQYNFSKNWITRLLESKFPFRIEHPFLASIFKLGLPSNLVFILFYLMRYEHITRGFLVAYIFALIWINLGPFLIFWYDERLLPDFFRRTIDVVPNREKLNKMAEKYDKMFSQKYWIITIPWTTLLVCIWSGLPTLAEGGIMGVGDLWFWIFLIGIVWMAILNSIGFCGVIVTISAIREISDETLDIDPLHPDRLGGLSCFGYFAIGTTLLFSTGSIILPGAFQILSKVSATAFYVYLAVLLFSLFTAFSFLYPTVRVHQKARSIRDAILDRLRKRHAELSSVLDTRNRNHGDLIASYLELYRLRNEYQDYKNVKLYPFEFETFLKLVTSVMLPFMIWVIETYFGQSLAL